MSGFVELDAQERVAWNRYRAARHELERQRIACAMAGARVRLYERLDSALGPLPAQGELRATLAERRARELRRWTNLEDGRAVTARRASRNLERTGLVPAP